MALPKVPERRTQNHRPEWRSKPVIPDVRDINASGYSGRWYDKEIRALGDALREAEADSEHELAAAYRKALVFRLEEDNARRKHFTKPKTQH